MPEILGNKFNNANIGSEMVTFYNSNDLFL